MKKGAGSGAASFGFNWSYVGANASPLSYTLNGITVWIRPPMVP